MRYTVQKLIGSITLVLTILFSSTVLAEEFVWAPDINPGDVFPTFSLSDQDGVKHSNGSLGGENGYLIQFNRSVVW